MKSKMWETGYSIKYFLNGWNAFRKFPGASISIGSGVKIKRCTIYVYPGSELVIDDEVELNGLNIYITQGKLTVGHHSLITKGKSHHRSSIVINNGGMVIGHHAKIASENIWIRFGGIVRIGDYTNINEHSEIRCDEAVTIGSYNQISYNVNIWDTNTHNVLPKAKRRELTEKYFPYFGYEQSKPITRSIAIGNDCWIGKNAAILKGTHIGNECIVGYNTILTGQTINDKKTVVNALTLHEY